MSESVCGSFHFGPVKLGRHFCAACARNLSNEELIAYWKLHIQVNDIMIKSFCALNEHIRRSA